MAGKTLNAKLFEIQKALKVIKKDETAQVGKFNYRYFDINALIDHLKPHLEANGLVVLQPLSHIDGKAAIRTIVWDIETGDKVEDVTPLTYNEDPQKMGSAITYFRRYALQSLFFLEAEDDDGAKASPSAAQKTIPTETSRAIPKTEHGGYYYSTGVSRKTGKTWYAKKPIGASKDDMPTWLTAQEYDSELAQKDFDSLGEAQLDQVPF